MPYPSYECVNQFFLFQSHSPFLVVSAFVWSSPINVGFHRLHVIRCIRVPLHSSEHILRWSKHLPSTQLCEWPPIHKPFHPPRTMFHNRACRLNAPRMASFDDSHPITLTINSYIKTHENNRFITRMNHET